MDRTKLQALLITAFIVVGVIFYFTPKPEGVFTGVTEKISNVFSSDSDDSLTKNKRKKIRHNSNHPDATRQIDKYNGVAVYHNGSLGSVFGRNTTADGYNLGLKYQCVEFVKRFYYEYYGHKMPNNYGNAREFFNYNLQDGEYNKDRGLTQYRNGSYTRPKKNSILIFDNDPSTKYGHVGIITSVSDNKVGMISQNNGSNQKTRSNFTMTFRNGKYKINNPYIVGWLNK